MQPEPRVIDWNQAQDRAIRAKQDEDEAWARVGEWVERHPEYEDKVAQLLRHWSETYYESSEVGHEFRAAEKMWQLTKNKAWGQRAKAALDALVDERRGA